MNMGQIVTILRDSPGGFDAFGDPVASTTARIDLYNCGIAPRSSTEPTANGRQGVIIGLSLYAPAETVIHFTDRIEINGGGTIAGAPVTPATATVYLVDGEMGTWRSPLSGTVMGVEVALIRGTG